MNKLIAVMAIAAMFATGAAHALPTPPPEPTYDRPSFDPPSEPPGNPPENPPEPPPENPPKTPPKPKVPEVPRVEHTVVCEPTPQGMVVKFTHNVEHRFFKEGKKFCHKLHPQRPIVAKCVTQGDEHFISLSESVSARAQKSLNRFCLCLWGLD